MLATLAVGVPAIMGEARALQSAMLVTAESEAAFETVLAKSVASVEPEQMLLPIFKEESGSLLALTKSKGGTGPARWSSAGSAPTEAQQLRRYLEDMGQARVHPNSLAATGPHDVYVMQAVENQTGLAGGGSVAEGQVLHYGETGRGYVTRGNEWRRLLFREYGIKAEVQFIRTLEGKAAARQAETALIKQFERAVGVRPGFRDASGNWSPSRRHH